MKTRSNADKLGSEALEFARQSRDCALLARLLGPRAGYHYELMSSLYLDMMRERISRAATE